MAGYYGSFVIPAMLATSSDYNTYWGADTAPTNVDALLRSCTTLVLDATEGAYYPVDALTGLSTDTDTRTAMRDATVIQAAAWAALGINPQTGGVATSGVKRSKKIGSASIEYADSDAAAAARATAYSSLVPDALRVLQQRNLLGNGPYANG